jgi:hypothetical protein
MLSFQNIGNEGGDAHVTGVKSQVDGPLACLIGKIQAGCLRRPKPKDST